MMSALQAIILDFDGVIADSEPLHLKAFQETLAELGVDLGLFRALARDRQLAIIDRQASALVTRKGELLQELLHGNDVLFPGVADFVRRAASHVPLGIASGAMRHEILEIVEGAGVGPLFSVIVAAGDTPESKPSPAPYVLAFEQLRRNSGGTLDPRRCVAVEDSRWGLESAQGAGLRCVGVTTSYSADELAGAELVVSGLDELTLPALDRLCAS